MTESLKMKLTKFDPFKEMLELERLKLLLQEKDKTMHGREADSDTHDMIVRLCEVNLFASLENLASAHKHISHIKRKKSAKNLSKMQSDLLN